MKSLQDFKEENKKDRPLSKDEGTDDKEYLRLMSQYKNDARHNMKPHEANKILRKAQKLSREGDVSKRAKLLGGYI